MCPVGVGIVNPFSPLLLPNCGITNPLAIKACISATNFYSAVECIMPCEKCGLVEGIPPVTVGATQNLGSAPSNITPINSTQIPDSCVVSCGGAAPSGCFCDDLCTASDDCCPDVEETVSVGRGKKRDGVGCADRRPCMYVLWFLPVRHRRSTRPSFIASRSSISSISSNLVRGILRRRHAIRVLLRRPVHGL